MDIRKYLQEEERKKENMLGTDSRTCVKQIKNNKSIWKIYK